MKASLIAVLYAAATLLAACTTTEPAASTAAVAPESTASSPATASAPKPAAPASSAAPVSSLRETQRIDRSGETAIPYPFDHCAVIQKPFGRQGPKYRRVYRGYEVLFCCTPCVRAFDMNPEPYMPRIIAAAGGGTATP